MTPFQLAAIVAGEVECWRDTDAPVEAVDLWRDETLTDDEQDQVYDDLFEYHSDKE